MNFTIYTNTRFKAGVDIFNRLYYAILKANNKIKIINALDESILFDNLIPDQILIDGKKMQNIADLEVVIFNKHCVCPSELDDENMRIFDETFDKTFE